MGRLEGNQIGSGVDQFSKGFLQTCLNTLELKGWLDEPEPLQLEELRFAQILCAS